MHTWPGPSRSRKKHGVSPAPVPCLPLWGFTAVMPSSPWNHRAGVRPVPPRLSSRRLYWRSCLPPALGVCNLTHGYHWPWWAGVYPPYFLLSFPPVFSVPSTLRSPSSPIHEEDEEKLSQDSDAPPPLSGAGLALSSSPEVSPFCHPVPNACGGGLQTWGEVCPGPPPPLAHGPASAGFLIWRVCLVWGGGVAVREIPGWQLRSCRRSLSLSPRALSQRRLTRQRP